MIEPASIGQALRMYAQGLTLALSKGATRRYVYRLAAERGIRLELTEGSYGSLRLVLEAPKGYSFFMTLRRMHHEQGARETEHEFWAGCIDAVLTPLSEEL